MSENLKLQFEITSRDNGTAATLQSITESMAALDRQAKKTAESLKRSLGGDLVKQFAGLRTEAKTFGSDLTDGAERAAKALRADVSAVAELRTALRGAMAEQKSFVDAARAAQTANLGAARAQAAAARTAASTRARASRDAVADVGRVWRVRQRSEAAELAHVRAVGRERAALRRDAMRSARDAGRHGHRAARSLNHPVHESVGFALATGAAAGAAFTGHVVQASEAFDTAMARLRMFAPQLDANAIRRQSLDDSIALGVDASKLVDAIAKSVRDGVPPEIARTLPKSIASAAQVMGGDVEKLTDSLAEGLQEAFSMGWLKTSTDARRFLNTEAGLSTFAGNTAAKQEQFIAAGGLGHGKEMGLDMTSTLAYGAMLNASGARTGQASARFMGQLSQNVPRMYDVYRRATESHRNSEEDRAVRSAPGRLGYGGVREMQHRIMAGPEGLIDFATRLQKLDDKTRKLVLEGYGFSEQGGAMLAELGANGGTKGKAVLARAKELAEQKEANDYLSEKFAEWQKSLSNMLQQIEAGWRAIENEIGDVIKADIVAPLRDWWVELSGSIVHSDLKDRIHRAIVGFVHGLGFEDVQHMLDGMTAGVHGFDFPGFARGVGEGIRTVVDDLKSLGSVFGGAGGLSAETVGRVATEMLGLSLGLKAVSPVLTTFTAIMEGIRALSAVLATARGLGLLMGVAGAGEGAGALATLGAGAAATPVGLAAMLGVAVVGGALAVAIMNWDAVKQALFGGPKETPEERAARPVRRLEDQSWWDFLRGAPRESIPLYSDKDRERDKYKGIFHRQSYDGDGFGDLRRNISWSPSDSGDVVRNAVVGTDRGVAGVRDAVDRLGARLTLASFGGAGASGFEGSGGVGGGGNRSAPSIRYGRPHSGAEAGGGAYDVGGRASAMSGDVASRASRAMAKLQAMGWSKEAAAAAIGNAQQESGVRSDGPLGDTKRFGTGDNAAHGMFQWRADRFRALKAFASKKGKGWQDFDTQLEFFDQESRRYGSGDWRSSKDVVAANLGMKRFEGYGDDSFGTRLANARQILAGKTDGRHYAAESSTNVLGGGGNAAAAVDKAMSMQGMGEGQAARALKHYMHSGEWCADFVNGALESSGVKGTNSAMAKSFSAWGHHVGFGDVKKGDVITERHGNHVGHVGMATGNVQRDRNGNVTAVEMISGNYGSQVRKNWESVGKIDDLRRSDQTDVARKVGAHGLAGKVLQGTKPHLNDAPAGGMTNADNSTTTNHWHLYGEAARQAVQQQFASRRSGATVDLDAFT